MKKKTALPRYGLCADGQGVGMAKVKDGEYYRCDEVEAALKKRKRTAAVMTATASALFAFLIITVVRLNGRVYELEKVQSFDHAAIIVYLSPDEKVVECYQEFLWREGVKK